MSDAAIRVPLSIESDSGDVSTALDVATALWEKGNHEESLRWLRRAVDAAREEGQASRAEEIGNAVAELARAAEQAGQSGPPKGAEQAAAPKGAEQAAAPKGAEQAAAPKGAEQAAAKAVDQGSPSKTADHAAPPNVADQGALPKTATAPPAAASPSTLPRAPASSVAPGPATMSRPPAGARAAGPSVRPVPASPPVPLIVAAPTISIPAGTPVRVSIRASARDPELLVVRPLPEGRQAPAGARVGTLILSEEDTSIAHKNGSAVS